MKKILLPLIMLGVFTFFPVKSMAMAELDENGNVIEKDVKEGEVSILMAPTEATLSSDGSDSSEPANAPDQSVSSDENRILSGENDGDYHILAEDEDTSYQTTAAEENTVKTTALEEDNDVKPLPIVASGVVGIALGSVATVLIRKKNND